MPPPLRALSGGFVRFSVDAGEVGLGVHSIQSGVKPYFVLVGPAADGGAQPVVSAPVPATPAGG